MHLHCPHCGDPIEADDIHLDTELARCAACHAVFSFATQVERDHADRAAARPPRSRDRARIDLPPRVTLEHRDGALRFRIRWFRPAVLLLACFAVVWNGFLVLWYTTGITLSHGGPHVCLLLFPLGHVAVGLALLYIVAAMFLNTTHVDVADGRLRIRHGPVPWSGARDLATAELAQLFVKQHVYHGRRSRRTTYELIARDRGRRDTKLLTGLDSAEVARYLEQEVERRLRIRDAAVTGEHPG